MKRLIIAALYLSVGLGGLFGVVSVQAQGGTVVYDDASGSDGSCTVTGPPDDQTVFCADRRRGREVVVNDSPGQPTPVVGDVPTSPVSKDADSSMAPAADAAAAPETTERAVASATDQDADNAPDDLEPGLGLDPTNPDSDGDGVADGDEGNLYGTDPLTGDTDGDGLGDGEELFGIHTDPLVWDDLSAQNAGSAADAP